MSAPLPLSLHQTHTVLGWPSRASVIQPEGAGPSVFASLVHDKIGRTIRRFSDAQTARTGVLMADPNGTTSEPPFAIVVEFESNVGTGTLRALQRLSWNFSHSPTVITIEPALLRVWSCCEAPDPNRPIEKYLVTELTARCVSDQSSVALEDSAARALHWINLASGHFFAEHADRFARAGRADQMLLNNLRYIRAKLVAEGLKDDDICHDLLARVIFVQFLFDRRDQEGKPALTTSLLSRLHKDGVLEHRHSSFQSILSDYDDTYSLFEWLNAKFNGDLFPGKGEGPTERARGWAREKQIVRPGHLSLLARFVAGDLNMPSHQMLLWPQYAFDVIPLEFISSIYETFVSDKASESGIYYTPPYLVDFVLDQVLPWDSSEWNLRILDPACGSGIFLVKAFQRLVHRWRRANPGKQIRADVLRRMLEQNLFGVDKDGHAVRVACFSLYLAMCDEIEPRHYWTKVTFPAMRDRRLVCSDFFSDDHAGFETTRCAQRYDLVIGNAPFGAGTATDLAHTWATSNGRKWCIPRKDIGGMFLAKGAELLSPNGRVALIQSANTLLFNTGTGARLRGQLLEKYRVDSIYNLSALRLRLFKTSRHVRRHSVAPVCVFVLTGQAPRHDDTIDFISPKHLRPLADEFAIVIEPQDRRTLTWTEATTRASIWPTLMWGAPRDRQLLERLRRFQTLGELQAKGRVKARQGVNFGDRKKDAPFYEGGRMFDRRLVARQGGWSFRAEDFPVVRNIRVHSRESTNIKAFAWPQLILRQSWSSVSKRFHAWLSAPADKVPVLCNVSYVSVHADVSVLEAATVAHNSKVAVYYHFLTSGRVAAYRPKLNTKEILALPIPVPQSGILDGLETYNQIDDKAFELFELKDAERVLVEDTVDYTIDGYVRGQRSIGNERTSSKDGAGEESHLRLYCSYLLRVLTAGVGRAKSMSATIFRCASERMPYRLVAVELGGNDEGGVRVREITSEALLEELRRLGETEFGRTGSIAYQRVVRVYEVRDGVPTIFLLKPDRKRFWTRSMGLQDGDEVTLDLFGFRQEEPPRGREIEH